MRTQRIALLIPLFGCFLLLPPSPAQSRPSTRPPETRPASEPSGGLLHRKDLARIVFIGASVSDGFGNNLPPSTLAKKALKGRGFKILRFSNSLFFMQPLKVGSLLMRRALRSKPTLLIGIDYLFWFGYGWMSDEARMKRLEKGLALLDRFKGKILVGNLPDMHGADPKMLQAMQIPSVPLLKKMNKRIEAWARKRKRVRLFDLSSLVARMKTRGIVLPSKKNKGEKRVFSPKELMSWDRLHPSKKGVHFLLHSIFESLKAWGGPSLEGSLAWDYVSAMKD